MKVILILVVSINFCLSALWGYAENQNQVRKAKVQLKITGDSVSQNSLPQNAIHIKGIENVISINNTNASENSVKTTQVKKTTPHTIDINGEKNSVNIHQNGNNGSVNINQTGNGNHVNVNQSTLKD
jgi:hypothetical protein